MTETTSFCTNCKYKHKVPLYSGINTERNPDLKPKVKDGSLFLWECPSCGDLNLATYNTLYHDPKIRLMIWLLPEDGLTEKDKEALEEKVGVLSKQMHEDLAGYTFRRVDDVGSLIEKVNIFDSGLDDTAIEMCKYVTKLEMSERITDKEKLQSFMDLPFKFYKLDGADNEIILSYPQNGEMSLVCLGLHIYEDCRNILHRNTIIKPAPGFARVNSEWLESFFR